MEDALGALEADIERLGHTTGLVRRQGDAHSIMVVDGRFYAGVDRRQRGGAAGY